MMNIGFGELAVICIVLIIAVGPERLPSMMRTIGKTMRTLRQASRDLRESTGIDELLREDFGDYRPPPRRPAPPPQPTISREASPAEDTVPATGSAPPALEASNSGPALPSDGPVGNGDDPVPVPAGSVTDPSHSATAARANLEGTLPSDAPVAAPAPAKAPPSDPDKLRET